MDFGVAPINSARSPSGRRGTPRRSARSSRLNSCVECGSSVSRTTASGRRENACSSFIPRSTSEAAGRQSTTIGRVAKRSTITPPRAASLGRRASYTQASPADGRWTASRPYLVRPPKRRKAIGTNGSSVRKMGAPYLDWRTERRIKPPLPFPGRAVNPASRDTLLGSPWVNELQPESPRDSVRRERHWAAQNFTLIGWCHAPQIPRHPLGGSFAV